MHPTEGVWRKLLDRETDSELQIELESHLMCCGECQSTVTRLRDQRDSVAGLLEQLGSPVPFRTAHELLRRASKRNRPRRMLTAATIALCLATAAGATVRAGLVGKATDFLRLRSSPASTHTPAAQTGVGVPTSSGVAFEPPGTLEVAFDEWQGRGEIVILLSPDSKFSIAASSPLDYAVRRGRVTVANHGSTASYRITLPLSLTEASIRVAGREVFSRRGASIRTQAKAEGGRTYVLPFSLPRRSVP